MYETAGVPPRPEEGAIRNSALLAAPPRRTGCVWATIFQVSVGGTAALRGAVQKFAGRERTVGGEADACAIVTPDRRCRAASHEARSEAVECYCSLHGSKQLDRSRTAQMLLANRVNQSPFLLYLSIRRVLKWPGLSKVTMGLCCKHGLPLEVIENRDHWNAVINLARQGTYAQRVLQHVFGVWVQELLWAQKDMVDTSQVEPAIVGLVQRMESALSRPWSRHQIPIERISVSPPR
ncbi:hypothetical protein G7054_g7481 [Neopestalotiopsis clavispora]|nr:hypothetical protein G7054_g7481 [Neopestalotiopsis clavispora]